MFKAAIVLALMTLLSGCAETQAIRTSSDTLIIHTSAAPSCGVQGALSVAQKMAAIETIRAGYDAYVIFDSDAQNNVTTETLPGSYHTNGFATAGNGYATYNATTTYQPGPTIYNGSNEAALHIKMFKKGQKNYTKAIPAREVLGSDWQELVANGIDSCS